MFLLRRLKKVVWLNHGIEKNANEVNDLLFCMEYKKKEISSYCVSRGKFVVEKTSR